MVSARETLVANAVAARDGAREFRGADTVNGALVALEVSEAGEVCGGGAAVDFAGPCSIGEEG